MLNRGAFIDRLEVQLALLDRHPTTLALLLLDLDHFKSINDQWGHPTGDRALRLFSEECLRVSRAIDMIARIGGEEFAILIVYTSRDEAAIFAERLRESIANLKISVPEADAEISLTVSIGFSLTSSRISSQTWIEQTDKALYLAKNTGRNCVKEYTNN